MFNECTFFSAMSLAGQLSSLLHLFYMENNPKSLNLQACVKWQSEVGFGPQKNFSLEMTKVIS